MIKFLSKYFLFALLLTATLFSCQKEFTIDAQPATGNVVKDSLGDCIPSVVSGSYVSSIATNASNYVDVNINFTQKGQYTIKTDTLNGFYFEAVGGIEETGVKSVRLQAKGTPIVAGINVFTVRFDSSFCEINVIVTGTSTAAEFTFLSTGTNCSATPNGLYQVGLAAGASNWVDLAVSTTVAGNYNITATSTANNGVSFSGTGSLAAGVGNVRLFATGTPLVQGNFNYAVAQAASSCNFDISYGAAAPNATYTVVCAAITAQGTYVAGTPTTSSNSIQIPVLVNTAGNYNITATTTNGTLAFAGSGQFNATGLNTIPLLASGTPATAGTTNVTLQLAGTTCNVSVTVLPAGTTIENDTLECTIGSAFKNFSVGASADYGPNIGSPGESFSISGATSGVEIITMDAGTSFTTSTAGVGLYSVQPNLTNGRYASATFLNSSFTTFEADPLSPPYPTPLFQINISSISGNRVRGTFTGKIGTATSNVTVTNGKFNLPY
jgi:hypothetical protein